MKIGKQPKRWKSGGGNPNKSVIDKRGSMAETSSVFPDWKDEPETEVPTPDKIQIYLDDERPCPEGWTLCRTPAEFFKLMKNDSEYLDRVTHLSLDWNLGMHQVDGVEVAKRLAYMFLYEHEVEERSFLPNLRGIGLHSSDRDAAVRMYNELVLVLKEIGREDSIRIRRNTPMF